MLPAGADAEKLLMLGYFEHAAIDGLDLRVPSVQILGMGMSFDPSIWPLCWSRSDCHKRRQRCRLFCPPWPTIVSSCQPPMHCVNSNNRMFSVTVQASSQHLTEELQAAHALLHKRLEQAWQVDQQHVSQERACRQQVSVLQKAVPTSQGHQVWAHEGPGTGKCAQTPRCTGFVQDATSRIQQLLQRLEGHPSSVVEWNDLAKSTPGVASLKNGVVPPVQSKVKGHRSWEETRVDTPQTAPCLPGINRRATSAISRQAESSAKRVVGGTERDPG
jgi:hypothetical protein